MITKLISAAVLTVAFCAPVSTARAQTCLEAGCADVCGPGYIQIAGKCLHVTDKGDRCVSGSFRAKLNGPLRTVGTPCTAKNDEGEMYSGWVGK